MCADANSHPHNKRVSQWEVLMRKFSDSNKEQCKSNSVDIPTVYRTAKTLPSGSKYDGTWDVLGMSGFGTYTFSHGVVYKGELHDGVFHGAGELRYPSGDVLRGEWKKGVMIRRTLTFNDGIQYLETDWKYCKEPDRRFAIERKNGLKPAGKSYLTAIQPPKKIPPGYYDTGDGLFDPKSNGVFLADNLKSMLRAPSQLEQKWIKDNCRFAPEKATGACKGFFENWLISGIRGAKTESSAKEEAPFIYEGDFPEDDESDVSCDAFSHFSDLEDPSESSSNESCFF